MVQVCFKTRKTYSNIKQKIYIKYENIKQKKSCAKEQKTKMIARKHCRSAKTGTRNEAEAKCFPLVCNNFNQFSSISVQRNPSSWNCVIERCIKNEKLLLLCLAIHFLAVFMNEALFRLIELVLIICLLKFMSQLRWQSTILVFCLYS